MDPKSVEHLSGGPAFPSNEDADSHLNVGMTLRDYFAAKSMEIAARGCMRIGKDFVAKDDFPNVAEDAYALADAMLKARDHV